MNTLAARKGGQFTAPASATGSAVIRDQCFVVAAGALVEGAAAVEAAGAAGFVEAAGAAAVEAVGAAVFSGLLQAAKPQTRTAAERTIRYFFMLVHHQNVRGRRKFMILLDDLNANRTIGREF